MPFVLSMNTTWARFSTADTWLGVQTQPITLNKYTYANANPIMYTDPSGYFGLSDISIGMNGQAMLATRAVSTTGLRSGVNKAITATLQVSGRATSKLALRKLRKCIREKNKCGLHANILVVGYDNPDMVDHIRYAQSTNPRSFVLTYLKNKKGNRQWYRGRPGCNLANKPAGYQCDEYPFFKTREGGPKNSSMFSLRWVPAGQNMSVGGHFGFLARNMRSPKNNKFIVVTSTNLPTVALPLGKK